MTREEAARVLKYMWKNRDENAKSLQQLTNSFFEGQEAISTAIAALRGPQPDPDTGLVPCGCGGKAKITEQSLNWLIKCVECGIQLEVYGGRGGAVWSWNRAMGWEDKG